MGLKQKQTYSTLKLVLPAELVAEFRAVKQLVEAAGFQFDVTDELAQALGQMRAQLASGSGDATGSDPDGGS